MDRQKRQCRDYYSGLYCFRRTNRTTHDLMYEPRFCVITQGAKRVMLGDDTYVYDAQHFLSPPLTCNVRAIIEANRRRPCLGLVLDIDPREISQLMVDSNLPAPSAASSRGWRSVRSRYRCSPRFSGGRTCFDEPTDSDLAPIIKREIFIVYW